ncbi:TPA: M protein trans-acting positive regulator, partial [Enterococcus faecium]
QRILVNILARLSITKIESEETSLEQYKLLKKANVPHVLYSREMVESLCTVFDLFIPEKEKILYSLAFARNKLYNGFLNFNQPNTPLPTFMLYQEHSVLKEVQTAIEQFYMDFREQNQHLLPVILEKENVQWMVEDLVHLYDRYKKQPRIVIGVNYTRDFYISKDLIVKIEQIFSNESIKIQNDFMENCNIVISDCPLKQLPSHIKKIYILKGIITPEDWKKVIMRISEYIFELKEEALMDQSKKENQVTS